MVVQHELEKMRFIMRHSLPDSAHARAVTASESTPPRTRILETAEHLFYKYGIRSVGIDRIIEQSDVAKMTFYKHFPSKSNLIAAYLERQEHRWRQVLDTAVGRNGSAFDRLLAIFDVLRELCDTPEFDGCPFIKAVGEFGWDKEEIQIQACISSHFSDTQSIVAKLLDEMDLPVELTQVIASLIFGALVVAHVNKSLDVIEVNKKTAETLLAAHSRRSTVTTPGSTS